MSQSKESANSGNPQIRHLDLGKQNRASVAVHSRVYLIGGQGQEDGTCQHLIRKNQAIVR